MKRGDLHDGLTREKERTTKNKSTVWVQRETENLDNEDGITRTELTDWYGWRTIFTHISFSPFNPVYISFLLLIN